MDAIKKIDEACERLHDEPTDFGIYAMTMVDEYWPAVKAEIKRLRAENERLRHELDTHGKLK